MVKLLTKPQNSLDFPLKSLVYSNRPIHPKDSVTVPVSIISLQTLFSNIELENSLKNLNMTRTELEALSEFFKAIDVALTDPNNPPDTLYLQCRYKSFKRAIDLIVKELFTSLSKAK